MNSTTPADLHRIKSAEYEAHARTGASTVALRRAKRLARVAEAFDGISRYLARRAGNAEGRARALRARPS